MAEKFQELIDGGWAMIKKFAARVGSIICISALVFSLTIVDVAWAQSGDNFIVAIRHSSMWAVNKSTRKLMFLKYQEENKVWKSDPITVPTDVDLNNTSLIATGREGTQVFLYDQASGFITFYEVQKDRSIKKFVNVDLATDLK
ncbi:MAG: hypothetical protein PVI73_15965 [Syntrophobacterales bacterium]